jgi:hypothetical protein
MNKYKNNNGGYALLLGVIILGSVIFVISISMIMISMDTTDNALVIEQSNKARFTATACIETGLNKIRENSSYSGTDTLIIDSNECTYTVDDMGGSNRRIQASSTIKNTYYRIEVLTDQLNPLEISSWQEIDDF